MRITSWLNKAAQVSGMAEHVMPKDWTTSANLLSQPWGRVVIDHFINKVPGGSEILNGVENKRRLTAQQYYLLFNNWPWGSDYGGKNWAEIAKSWGQVQRIAADQSLAFDPYKAAAELDHTFDLVHNNDTLFTKASWEVRRWIMDALNIKRYCGPTDLVQFVSPEVKKFFYQYIRHSGSWQTWKEEDARNRVSQANALVQQLLDSEIDFNKFLAQVKSLKVRPTDFLGNPHYLFFGVVLSVHLSGKPLSRQINRVLARMSKIEFPHLFDLIEPLPSDRYTTALELLNIVTGYENVDEISKDPAFIAWFMEKIPQLGSTKEKMFADFKNRYYGTDPRVPEGQIAWVARFLETNPAIDSNTKTSAEKFSRQLFFDFYLLNVIDPASLNPDDAKRAQFIYRYTIHAIAQYLNEFMGYACQRESRHVFGNYALDTIGVEKMKDEQKISIWSQSMPQLPQWLQQVRDPKNFLSGNYRDLVKSILTSSNQLPSTDAHEFQIWFEYSVLNKLDFGEDVPNVQSMRNLYENYAVEPILHWLLTFTISTFARRFDIVDLLSQWLRPSDVDRYNFGLPQQIVTNYPNAVEYADSIFRGREQYESQPYRDEKVRARA